MFDFKFNRREVPKYVAFLIWRYIMLLHDVRHVKFHISRKALNLVTSQIWFTLTSAKKKREKRQEYLVQLHRKISSWSPTPNQ